MPVELRRPLLRSGLIACLLTAARPGAAGAEPCAVPDTTHVIRVVGEVMARERIPGLVVGFTLDSCTWVRAYGTADVEDDARCGGHSPEATAISTARTGLVSPP